MKAAWKQIRGAFRILRRRSIEVGQPGLRIWSDAGERATEQLGNALRDTAHRAECSVVIMRTDLLEMLADGKIDATEFRRLVKMPRVMSKVADDCHDLGEVVS